MVCGFVSSYNGDVVWLEGAGWHDVHWHPAGLHSGGSLCASTQVNLTTTQHIYKYSTHLQLLNTFTQYSLMQNSTKPGSQSDWPPISAEKNGLSLSHLVSEILGFLSKCII